MGNSLLDITVFGRRSGVSAAKFARQTKVGKLTLKHVAEYEQELQEAGIETDRKSPMLLPDYRFKAG